MSRHRGLVKGVLLTFVVFTAGYAVGKEVGARRALAVGAGTALAAAPAPKGAVPRQLIVRYYHGTKRCTTCNKIEAYAKEAVEGRFADDLAAGRLTWETANMDDVWNADAVRRYDLIRSSLVLLDMAGAEERGFQVLDATWNLVGEKAHFTEYVTSEVQSVLDGWAAGAKEE